MGACPGSRITIILHLCNNCTSAGACTLPPSIPLILVTHRPGGFKMKSTKVMLASALAVVFAVRHAAILSRDWRDPEMPLDQYSRALNWIV